MSRNQREGWYFGTVRQVLFMEPRRPVLWHNGRRHIRTKIRLAALQLIARVASHNTGGKE